jgi:hypothetical protein
MWLVTMKYHIEGWEAVAHGLYRIPVDGGWLYLYDKEPHLASIQGRIVFIPNAEIKEADQLLNKSIKDFNNVPSTTREEVN